MISDVQQIDRDRISHSHAASETDARIKVSLAVFAILVTALIPTNQWWAYLFIWFIVLILSIILRIDKTLLVKRSLLVLPFFITAVPLIFHAPPDFWISVGDWEIGINQSGLFRCLAICVKSLLSVQIAALLIMTTPHGQIMSVLHAFKVPEILVSVMTMMWRYLEVIVDEARRMMQARASRSASPVEKNWKMGETIFFRASVTGGMAGSLFIRSLERSERVYQAMLARGYDGKPRGLPLQTVNPLSRSVGIVGFSILSGILLAAYWLR